MAHLPIYQAKNPLNSDKMGHKKLIALIAVVVIALVFVASEFGYGFTVSPSGSLGFGSGNANRASSNGLIIGFVKQLGSNQPPQTNTPAKNTATPIYTARQTTVLTTAVAGQPITLSPTLTLSKVSTISSSSRTTALPTVTPVLSSNANSALAIPSSIIVSNGLGTTPNNTLASFKLTTTLAPTPSVNLTSAKINTVVSTCRPQLTSTRSNKGKSQSVISLPTPTPVELIETEQPTAKHTSEMTDTAIPQPTTTPLIPLPTMTIKL